MLFLCPRLHPPVFPSCPVPKRQLRRAPTGLVTWLLGGLEIGCSAQETGGQEENKIWMLFSWTPLFQTVSQQGCALLLKQTPPANGNFLFRDLLTTPHSSPEDPGSSGVTYPGHLTVRIGFSSPAHIFLVIKLYIEDATYFL